MSYTPQPGTFPARVIGYLQAQARIGREWVPLAEIEAHVDQDGLSSFLTGPIKHGALQKRPMAGNLRLVEYALGKGIPMEPFEDNEPDTPLNPVPATPKAAAAIWPPTTQSKTGAANVATRKTLAAPEYINIDTLEICDDPVTARSNSIGDKYGPLFSRMKVGQCIKCRPEDAPKIGNALRKWRDTHRPECVVQAVRQYPADGLGRVWLMAGPAKGAK